MAAKGMLFPWRWISSTISTNLDVIWGMSVKAIRSFEALGHVTRFDVLRLLIPTGVNGLAAGDISKRLDLPPNSLSFHLGRLVNAGLIECRRSGRNLFYAADYARIAELVRYFSDECCADAPDGCLPECPTVAAPASVGCGSAYGAPDNKKTSRRK